jgi:hypothetical protein
MKGIFRLAGFVWMLSLANFALAQDKKVINDKNAQERKLDGFDKIDVSGAIELYISQGPETKVVISAKNAEDVEEIETEVRNGTLYIHYKHDKSWWSNQWNTMGRSLRAYVSAPEIRALTSSGSGSMYIEGLLKAEKLDLEISGSGNINGKVDVDELEVDQSGSSNIRLSGTARRASFDCSGSGNIDSPELVTDQCEIEISGSGNAYITANKEISASISGSGNVRYRGDATIGNLSVAGSGKLKKM